MNGIQKKILRVFFLVILALSGSVKEKGGKPDRKPYPLPYGLRNPYRNLKSENSQDYAQKPQCNCTFMNPASDSYVPRGEVRTTYVKATLSWKGCGFCDIN